MRSKTATRELRTATTRLLFWLATLVLLVGSVLGSTIASAAGYSAPCDVRKSSTASADSTALNITVVDLTEEASADLREMRDIKEATADDDDAESKAPPLYLAPRVESIVRQVFSETEADTAPTQAMPPLADSHGSDVVHDAEEDDADYGLDEPLYSPLRIYREMYRTDI